MNDKKISFIYCVNNFHIYDESVKYIKGLNVPDGYEFDIIPIENPTSITSGYNKALALSDAKYKVYLHQDVFILNKNFIFDILDIFQQDLNIGLLGLTGSKVIPTTGILNEAQIKYGKIYDNRTGQINLYEFEDILNKYETVQAIEGFIMITQYDISWRDDLFDDLYYYSTSQSVEFLKKGYQVVVPKQAKPWCLHDCGIKEYELSKNCRKNFLEEYSNEIYPLVSILIPTYNRPELFQLALESAINQTYKNIEIIIGDDSTNDETEELIRKNYLNKYSNIKYYHNKSNLGQFKNDIKLYNMSSGEFVNYLMDDDVFEFTKIEKMMDYFINDVNQEISLVTSYRGTLDYLGNKKGVFGDIDKIFKSDTVLDGIKLGNLVLINNFNCIGEPTTVLFRKSKLEEPFGVFNNREYGCNVDQATWLNLLSNGKAVIITEILSYFRIHDSQQLSSPKMKLLGAVDYAHEILTANKKGFIQNTNEARKALSRSILYCEKIISEFNYSDEKELNQEFNNLIYYFNKLQECYYTYQVN
ncbi:glycosyltransferase [Neobacillus terrae]|uniref:glycosyltransferase n=1 Tax=Neobacillus terrae TaxID=3034837 RepID=UPI0014075C28|nr:glycosyltransferase [Neobacillus terrae]NHM29959.1 glycosyltransferase [Neobacillus terrae]